MMKPISLEQLEQIVGAGPYVTLPDRPDWNPADVMGPASEAGAGGYGSGGCGLPGHGECQQLQVDNEYGGGNGDDSTEYA